METDNKTYLYEEYTARINNVQDYIENNLSEEFSLLKLSKIANFSPYHFHRIFYSITRETLFQFIQRIRLEKAAFFLLANRNESITNIALKCGFSNQSSFAKAFKKNFNISASELRRRVGHWTKDSDCITESNMGKVFNEVLCYNSIVRNRQEYIENRSTNISYNVEVKTILEMKAIYIRHTGPYKKDSVLFERLFGKLYKWANMKNLIHSTDTKWLTLCHDAPDITAEDKLRISVCMLVEEDVETSGEVGSMIIQGGKYAIGHFEINEDQYQDAWIAMSCEWLPSSGYQPDDRLSFELYQNIHSDKGNKQTVDIYIPIKPLSN